MANLVGGDQIALGTKQYLLVEVTDIAATVFDLAPHNPRYTVQDDADNYGYNNQAGSAVDMTVYALIDTTVDPAGAFTWTADTHYRLWVRFDLSPENPYLGPFDFYVI